MNVGHVMRRAAFGLAILGLALISQTRGLTQGAPAPTTHTVTLRDARVSRINDTHIVITAETLGDIKGSITLRLESDPRGWSGTWVLVSSYVRDKNPDGTPVLVEEHHEEQPGEPHHEYIEFVRDGSLNGLVNGGTVNETPEGVITSATFPMTLLGGTLTFQGVTGGGDVSLSALEDAAQSTGTLSLLF